MIAPLFLACGSLRSTLATLRGSYLDHRSRDGRLPQQVSDQVIFADVMREVVDTGTIWRGRRRGEGVEVRASKHVALTYRAGRDGDGGDGGVVFGVGGGEEERFEGCSLRQSRYSRGFCGEVRDVDDEW